MMSVDHPLDACNRLAPLQELLAGVHEGRLERDEVVKPWFNPATLDFFLEHARELQPRSILFGVGRPLRCHANALEAGVMFPRSRPWFGFRLLRVEDGLIWWMHSWLVTPTGSIFDSGPADAEVKHLGVPWSAELHQRLPKIIWD